MGCILGLLYTGYHIETEEAKLKSPGFYLMDRWATAGRACWWELTGSAKQMMLTGGIQTDFFLFLFNSDICRAKQKK